MTTTPTLERPLVPHAWDELDRLFPALFVGVLAIASGIVLADPGLSVAARGGSVGLALALGAWQVVGARRLPPSPAVRIAHLATTVGLLVALVARDDRYSIVLYAVYPLLFAVLPRWWAVAATPVAGLAVFGVAGDGLTSSLAVTSAVASTGLGLVLALFIDGIGRQSEQRHLVIAELDEARAALATTMAEREALAREHGVLQERQRLASELHDTVAQSLSSVVVQLEACEQALDADRPAALAHLGRARDAARSGLDEARRSVAALRPRALEASSLPAALTGACGSWSGTGSATLAIEGAVRPLHPEVEVTLLRVAQESLANAGKHGGPCDAELLLRYSDSRVRLAVRDDGCGFDPGTVTGDGFGLASMRLRVERLGGSFSVSSRPGNGTAVDVDLPAAAP